ncbi:hypothetical protein PINS_up003973 [Pythium insidiosum]|nr:hypothetical protein PINS_up003973 [Pythium insidiosum]
MVHDLSLQSAVLRGKSNMSFERTLSHALRHGARAQVIRWLLDLQLHKRLSKHTQAQTQAQTQTPDGHDDEIADWVSLWCDAITGFQDDITTLDVLRECIPVDMTASDTIAQQVRSALGGRRDPDLALLRRLRNEWPTLVIPHRVVDVAASQGQQDVVEWLCDDSASERFTQAALQGALDAHHYATFVYLLRRCSDPEQTTVLNEDGSTSPMLDIAACEGDLALVRALHELAPVVSCTTAALDAAAAYGDLKMVQYLHATRSEGCTTAAMDNAAANGHLAVVRFLHEHRAEGCTTKAVDSAAGNGHLDVVEFLLSNRHEGCTPDAMDRAVENDHLDIVKYLHSTRSEGCTSQAWARVKSREMVAFLREHKLQLLTTPGLSNLLMCGMFEEWRDLRSCCKESDAAADGDCDDSDGAKQAMVRAGRELKASVIRFLAREMGRVELEPWAMDGAVETQSVGWLHMIHEICGYGCNFTAVIKAINADTDLPRRTPETKLQESVACVLFLVSICLDATAENAMDYALSSRNSGLGSELEMWSTSPDMSRFSTMIDPIFCQVEMPDWVLEDLYHFHDRSWRFGYENWWWAPDQRDPWPRLACKAGNFDALKLLHEAGHAPSYPPDDDEEFHFFPGSAHALAAECGHLEMVKWLVEHFPSPVVPRMLEVAACHGHVDVARWLLSVLPENFTLEGQFEYVETKNISVEAVQWIETTPCMAHLRDYTRIAHDAAKHGRIDVLKYVFAKDPQCLVYRLGHVALTECQMDVLRYLHDEAHYDFSIVPLETVYSIRSQREDVVKFFLASKHEEIRNPNSFPSVLRGAAVRGLYKVTSLLLEAARDCDVAVDVENVLAATRRSQRSDRESLTLVMNQLGLLSFLQHTESW